MINLLPEKAKKDIIFEYWVRVVSVWFFILSVVCAVVSLLLLPSYVLVDSQAKVLAVDVDAARAKVAEYDLSALALAKANTQAQMLFELKQVKNFTTVLSELDSLQNSNITISDYEFKRNGLKLNSVQLFGEAKTRQSLADFRDALLGLPDVAGVNLPIGNLARDRDILFSISITFKESEN